jgi:hypothetical protein
MEGMSARMRWATEKVIRYAETDFKDGLPWYGFHDRLGEQYICSYFKNYFGYVLHGKAVWTAGRINPGLSNTHYDLEIYTPKYICRMYHQNALLISESKHVYKLDLSTMAFSILIECEKANITDSGSCVCDFNDDIWINDTRGCALSRFSSDGKLIERVGQQDTGFNKGTVAFDEAAFHWIYDIRLGPDGHLYMLDSKNYAVRRIEIDSRTVTTICGDGTPGDSPRECDISEARFGSSPNEFFDGPWSLFVDEECNIIVGDTWNHAIRVIEHDTNKVKTIAPTDDDVSFYRICGMDYCNGILYIPDWLESGYTITLIKKHNEPA